MKYLLLALITLTLVNISLMYAVTQQNKENVRLLKLLNITKCAVEIDYMEVK